MIRSMLWAGKPTDNPVNEVLNGWIKEELIIGFKIKDAGKTGFQEAIEGYVKFYNERRLCLMLAIGYDTLRTTKTL